MFSNVMWICNSYFCTNMILAHMIHFAQFPEKISRVDFRINCHIAHIKKKNTFYAKFKTFFLLFVCSFFMLLKILIFHMKIEKNLNWWVASETSIMLVMFSSTINTSFQNTSGFLSSSQRVIGLGWIGL